MGGDILSVITLWTSIFRPRCPFHFSFVVQVSDEPCTSPIESAHYVKIHRCQIEQDVPVRRMGESRIHGGRQVVVLLDVTRCDLVVVVKKARVIRNLMLGKNSRTFSLALIFDSGHVEGSVAGGLSFFFLIRAGAFAQRSTSELCVTLGIVKVGQDTTFLVWNALPRVVANLFFRTKVNGKLSMGQSSSFHLTDFGHQRRTLHRTHCENEYLRQSDISDPSVTYYMCVLFLFFLYILLITNAIRSSSPFRSTLTDGNKRQHRSRQTLPFHWIPIKAI